MRWILWTLTIAAMAQTPSFDVATVKLNSSGNTAARTSLEDHGVRVVNVPVIRLIMLAYGLTEAQIADAPGWLTEMRWDMQAKSPDLPATPTPDQVVPLMRGLLEDRFGLKTHYEPRTQAVYRLSMDRGGSKMKLSDTQEAGGANVNASSAGIRMDAHGVNLDEFARMLTRRLDRQVVNRTGLEGFFDFQLSWVPELAAPTESAGPTVYTAIREQMGLRLESAREPVDVLVIDSISQPSDN